MELRARGMPLGLMTGMAYEQKETVLEPGDSLLLHSDGIVEAHDPQGRMYGFPRLKEVVGTQPGGGELIDFVLRDLAEHIGPGAEQEDDITMVTVQRAASAAVSAGTLGTVDDAELLVEVVVPSAEGNERLAMEAVGDLVAGWAWRAARVDRLKTAVAEATMNAMEHGSGYAQDRPVTVRVLSADERRPGADRRPRGGRHVRPRRRGARHREEAGGAAASARVGPVPHHGAWSTTSTSPPTATGTSSSS